MLYCEMCRIENLWPASIDMRRSTCECCGKRRICHDRPLTDLPANALRKKTVRTRAVRAKAVRKKTPALSLAKRRVWALERALERSNQALHDWVTLYAPEQQSQKSLGGLQSRLRAYGGTLGYIADVLRQNREALGKKEE